MSSRLVRAGLVTIGASNSAGYILLAIVWLLSLLAFVGYLHYQLWKFSKEKRSTFEPTPADGEGCMYHTFVLPFKMFRARFCFKAPSDSSKGKWKAQVKAQQRPSSRAESLLVSYLCLYLFVSCAAVGR